APQRPRETCAGVVDLGLPPRRAIVGADLHLRDAFVACEGDALDQYRPFDWQRPIGPGRVKSRMDWDHKVWPPALLLVEPLAVVVDQLDTGQPFHMLLAEHPWGDQAYRIAMVCGDRLAVHPKDYQRGW